MIKNSQGYILAYNKYILEMIALLTYILKERNIIDDEE